MLRDLNRYRKIYPFLRRKPMTARDGPPVEGGTLEWTNSDEAKTYTFNYTKFKSIPSVVVSPVAVAGGDANVNLFITSITSLSVTIQPSGQWTGKANIQIAIPERDM